MSFPRRRSHRTVPGGAKDTPSAAGLSSAALNTHLRNRALRALAMRECSVAKLREKLVEEAAKQTANSLAGTSLEGSEQLDIIEAVMALLEADGYVSDARFSESRARSLSGRGKGQFVIAQKLSEAGVPKDIKREQMQALELDIDWGANALGLLQRKFAKESTLDAAQRAKAQRFLASRGFNSTAIRFALKQFGESQSALE
jgi:regulatory protein